MTEFDDLFRPLADELISEFGKDMKLRRTIQGAYDPTVGNSTDADIDYAVKGIITNPSPYMLANGVVEGGDRIVLFAAQAMQVEPVAGDQLLIDDTTWRIMRVRQQFSGDEIATYELTVRS